MDINEYIDKLKSSSPTPGGGSASAITSMFSASLNSMASLLSVDKKGLVKYRDDYNSIIMISNENIDKLKLLMTEDENHFMAIMNAFKTDKNDPDRIEKINTAIKNSIIISWKIANISFINIKNAYFLSVRGNKNLISDNISSVYMSYASFNTSISNIRVNLKFYSGDEFKNNEKLKIKLFDEMVNDYIYKIKKIEKNL